MSKNLEAVKNLKPYEVFKYFAEISDIPRGSGNTDKISEYLVNFAIKNNLKYKKDDYNNVIITKESKNKKKSAIALQAHIDMVCVKTEDCNKDMTKEGVDFVIDGEWLKADKTSLGADDGIGMAMILAILSDENDYERDIVGIFTNNEEIGLLGAIKIDLSDIKVDKLINIDNEEFGVIVAGCAGGTQVEYDKNVYKIDLKNVVVFELEILGGFGGHSAKEIVNNRANAIVEISKLLYLLSDTVNFNIVSIDGGKFDNAIPSECKAIIATEVEYKEAAIELLNSFTKDFKNKFSETDNNVCFRYSYRDKDDIEAFSVTDTIYVLNCLAKLPNGLIEMNEEYKDIPKTSLNLGIVKTDEEKISFTYLTRSNVNSEREKLNKVIKGIADENKFIEVRSDSYPAWEYRKTELEKVAVDTFKKKFNDKLIVKLTHGGLECGILLEKLGNIEVISLGPTTKGMHSTSEKLEIDTVGKCYEFLLELLRN